MNDLFSALYELFGYIQDFSEDLYELNVNTTVGILMVIISLAGMAVYYYVINHPKFNRWFHWLIVVVALALINFGIAWAISDGVLFNYYQDFNQEVPYSTIDFITYGIVNAVWAIVFSFVFSIAMKWKSTNCEKTPF